MEQKGKKVKLISFISYPWPSLFEFITLITFSTPTNSKLALFQDPLLMMSGTTQLATQVRICLLYPQIQVSTSI